MVQWFEIRGAALPSRTTAQWLAVLQAADIAAQVSAGSRVIAGVMIESHLAEGRQDWKGKEASAYGCSITDACISFEQTVPVLDGLAAAVRARRALPAS